MKTKSTAIADCLNRGDAWEIKQLLETANSYEQRILKKQLTIIHEIIGINCFQELEKWQAHYQKYKQALSYPDIIALALQDLKDLRFPLDEIADYGIAISKFNYYTCYADPWYESNIREFGWMDNWKGIFSIIELAQKTFYKSNLEKGHLYQYLKYPEFDLPQILGNLEQGITIKELVAIEKYGQKLAKKVDADDKYKRVGYNHIINTSSPDWFRKCFSNYGIGSSTTPVSSSKPETEAEKHNLHR